jgi:CheY-like chemotaxis protein
MKRVLLVDDEAMNLLFLKKLCSHLHVSVDTALNGDAAVELFAQNRYDLVFMDIHMPVMNGLDALNKIREMEIEFGYHTPVVAITSDSGIHESMVRASSFDEMVFNPINIELIRSILTKYLL